MIASSNPTPEKRKSGEITFPVDAEHAGIRVTGCTSFIAIFIASFLLMTMLIQNIVVLAGIIGVVIAGGSATLIERTLRGRWASGRELHADTDAIRITDKGETERKIDPSLQVNMLAWHFTTKRASRVKKGWHVIGLALEQDGEFVPAYTFAAPDTFDAWEYADLFTKLAKDKKRNDDNKSVMNMRHAGEQRRLREAEQDRGIFGAEMTFEQFNRYIQFLQTHYPDWMSK
jgi:hypothetical protein